VYRILVTGAAGWVGGTVVSQLEQRAGTRVFAVDGADPRVEFASEFRRLSHDRLDLAHHLLAVQPDVVVHAPVVDRVTLGAAEAHGDGVVGAQALFGAIGRSHATRRVVVVSDSAIYGASPRNPSVLAEHTEPRGGSDPCRRDLAEIEGLVRDAAQRRDDLEYTILRLAPIIGAQVGNAISRYLTLPAVPTLLGFDPRMQFIHEIDAVRAVTHAVDHGVTGTFNVAAHGLLYLSRVLRLGQRVPQPLPAKVFDAALRGLSRFDAALPQHMVALLKYGTVMDTRLMFSRLGFSPQLTCRQAVLTTYGRAGKTAA
jgi:UDP-glucose 4-epimerase